jgi:hypothetical protein
MALHESLDAQNIPVMDARPVLERFARDGILPYSETRDGHLSPSGHQAVADLIQQTVMRPSR